MADSFIQVQPDSTGKKLQTYNNTVSANSVHSEAVTLVDSAGVPIAPALDATLTGGTAKAIVRGGAKGSTAAADVTSTASGANHQGADVCLYDGSGNLINPTAIRALTASDVVTAAQGTAAAASAAWPVKVTDGTNTTAVKAASTAAAAADPSAVVALSPNSPVPSGTNRIGSVRPVDSADADLTAAKGSQPSRFLGTQDAKDSGRVTINWTAEVAGAATTEGLLTVTESRDGAATTTFTTKVVTNAKRLRITSVIIAVESLGSGTAPQRCYLRMRFNTGGAVTTGSSLQTTWECANNPAVVKTATTVPHQIPDGIEFLGDGTKQIGFTIQFPDWVTSTATVQAKITITAFEY